MSVRQYIGARYVTKIYENTLDPSSAEWEASINYEPLTMVTFNYGSYLSKKQVPASVGNPADNPTYWAQTGFYNGQIAQLQNNLDEITNTLYIVGADAKYNSISDAFTDCIANGGGTILITEGVYDEFIVAGIVNVPVTFLGTNRKKSIWKCSIGDYNHAPFTGGGNLTFENLTLYKEAPPSQTVEGGYALHLDYPGATGQMNIINCDLISEENAALGCGTRTNQEIFVSDCYLECDLKNGIVSTNGALLYHTAPEGGHTGQKFSLINCELKSMTVIASILNSLANTENVPLRIVNNRFYSTDPAYAPGISTYEQAFGYTDVTVNSAFIHNDVDMIGNNCNTFNINKYSNTYNAMVKEPTGAGFIISGSVFDSDMNNGFFTIPDTNTVEIPSGTPGDYYYGFVFGYGPMDYLSRTYIAVNFTYGNAYKKVIRQGTVLQDWTPITFGT